MRLRSSSGALRSTEGQMVVEYEERVLSIERARQLRIAMRIARIYTDVLNEPVPAEIARLLASLEADQETRPA